MGVFWLSILYRDVHHFNIAATKIHNFVMKQCYKLSIIKSSIWYWGHSLVAHFRDAEKEFDK